MRKIRVKAKKMEKSEEFFDSKKQLYRAGIVVAVILIIIGIFIYIENTDNKIVVNNNTDLKLEYVKAFFVGPEEAYNEGINITDLAVGEKQVLPQEPINLFYAEANLEVRFKFEGHDELFVDAGYFDDNFSGKITINFETDKDGRISLKVKAKPGIFNNPRIICDEHFIVNLEEGYVED